LNIQNIQNLKLSKEFKAGLIAIVAIALFVFGYNYLKGNNLLNKSRTFYAVYDDVQGLGNSSPVTINGLQVGQVSDIRFLNETGKVLVELSINSDFQFSKNSVVNIFGGDFIGGKSIAIEPNFKNPTKAVSGDTLIGNIDDGLLELVNDKLTPLQAKIERSVVSIDSLVTSVNQVLNPNTRSEVQTAVAELTLTLKSIRLSADALNKNINQEDSDLNQSISNFNKTSENLVQITDSLSQIEYQALVANIDQTLLNLNQVTTKISDGEGSLGKLINDEDLYTNLEKSSKELELLFKDIKENPKRYVHFSLFGKKHTPYQNNQD